MQNDADMQKKQRGQSLPETPEIPPAAAAGDPFRLQTKGAQAEPDAGDPFLLQRQLEQYAAAGLYPFHMPGHKRRMQPAPGLSASWDVTEVPGTDDLHDAKGILFEAMQRTAALWGADRTWYLVNGSTCGLLAGIHALARPGSKVICARNCHKAVYHAIGLAGYRVHWVMPSVIEEWGICGGIRGEQIRRALLRHPDAAAVILTSPTYEGVLSEVDKICGICHKKGIPVLVDEAHGAHLMPLSERAGFPKGALACGADLVVQSPHKTLPSLTQTALLHLQGTRVKPWRIEEGLDLFETSSPSYLMMASLDGCTGILRGQGEALFRDWAARLERFAASVLTLQKIRVFGCTGEESTPQSPGDGGIRNGSDRSPASPAVPLTDTPEGMSAHVPQGLSDHPAEGGSFLRDPGKILIDARGTGRTGAALAAVLRERYRMETEMASGFLVLAMTSICDDEDALDRLAAALQEIEEEDMPASAMADDLTGIESALAACCPAAACTISQAMEQLSEPVPAGQAAGRISAGYLYFYPPGIPFLAPGEIVPAGLAGFLETAYRNGLSARGISQDGMIRCLRE